MSVSGNSMGMKPTQALISYDIKPRARAPDENDVKSYVEYLQQSLYNAKMELKEYKKIIEMYRSEILGMQRNLETLNNDNLKTMVPVIQHDTEYFNQAMASQRQENINLQ